MNRSLFRRYVWLVDTIRHAGKLQYEDIADHWLKSELNDGNSPLALRTFHNHRHAVEDLFGIQILCDRSDKNHYFINESANPNATRLKIWMMQELGYSDIDKRMAELSDKIVLDSIPDDKFGINVLIEGIQKNIAVNLVYAFPTSDGKTSLLVAPYCIMYRNNQWLFIGKDTDTGILHSFDLKNVVKIFLSDKNFSYPAEFSPGNHFRNTIELPE